MPSEQDLIEGCRRRHGPSQEGLYRLYWSYAMSVCLRYAPSRDDALELAHDGFVKAFAMLDGFETGRPFKPWFRQILVRCAIDRHRSVRRYHATITPSDDPPEIADAPDQIDALEADDILALLAELPAIQRDVFNLYEIEGYAHAEIADLLDIAVGTSRAYLTRAKSRLQALYHAHIQTVS